MRVLSIEEEERRSRRRLFRGTSSLLDGSNPGHPKALIMYL